MYIVKTLIGERVIMYVISNNVCITSFKQGCNINTHFSFDVFMQ